MELRLAGLGALISAVLMLPLAIKWKLPQTISILGIVGTTVMAALPFAWLYPRCRSGRATVVVFLGQAALGGILAVSLIMVRFWRDPERTPPEKDGIVVSAADGKVAYVKTLDDSSIPLISKRGRSYRLEELTGTRVISEAVHIIGIEMSYLDVHVTRSPIAGRVARQQSIAGGFLSLRREVAPFVNARLTTVIEDGCLSVAVVQVASRLVRHVQSYLGVGESVELGARLGMIRFGSLVALILPARSDVSIEARPGDHVLAGISIIGRYETDLAETDA